MSAAAIGILAFVTLQRLAELWISKRNTSALLAQGAREHGRGHYPLIVAVHVAWLATLWSLAPGQPIHWPLIGLFALLQAARVWVLATLGPRWTTRIITLPGAPLVRSGPYRWVRHPNYVIVSLEIVILPLAFGLETVAVVFTLLNASVLGIRIAAENKVLTAAAPAP